VKVKNKKNKKNCEKKLTPFFIYSSNATPKWQNHKLLAYSNEYPKKNKNSERHFGRLNNNDVIAAKRYAIVLDEKSLNVKHISYYVYYYFSIFAGRKLVAQ
jgi:hypothetical protein